MLSFSWFASFLFFINVVGYGWGPALCAAELHSVCFIQQTSFRLLCFIDSLEERRRLIDFLLIHEINWSEREDWIELVGMKTYNLLCRIMKSETLQWRQQPINQTNLHFTSIKQKEINFLFLFMKFNESFWFIEENENKKYYNSMLKVISWYKLNHKWKTTWIWWKLAGMIGWFMNEMTFKPRKNEINKQIQFFSLEWEELICVDGVGGAAAQENEWATRIFERIEKMIGAVSFLAERLIGWDEWVVWFIGWVMGRTAPNGSAQGREQQHHSSIPIKQNKRERVKWIHWTWMNWWSEINLLIEWNQSWIQWMNATPHQASFKEARQAKQQTQFLFFVKKWNVFVERRRGVVKEMNKVGYGPEAPLRRTIPFHKRKFFCFIPASLPSCFWLKRRQATPLIE